MTHHATMPKTKSDYDFLAAVAVRYRWEWREVAKAFRMNEDKAEALLRSKASSAFRKWFDALPPDLKQLYRELLGSG